MSSFTKTRAYFFGGIIICLLGAICFSTKAIVVKLAYRETDVDAVSLLALRMIFSLPFFIISAIVSSSQKSNVQFTAKQWLSIALIGSLGYYVSSLLDFVGLQYVSAAIERLILFIYPTLVLLMTSLIFKVKIKPLQWGALLLTYAGLFIAFFSEIDWGAYYNRDFFFGAILIFACAFTYAGYIVGSGRLIPIVGAAKFNSYAMSFACISVLIHFFITNEHSLFEFSGAVYIYSILMAIVSTVIPSYLVSEGIKRIGSNNAAIVGSVGPVSTIIQAYIFLNEPVLPMQLLGTACILVGVLMISRTKKESLLTSVSNKAA